MLLLLGWLPAVGRAQARRVVLGVAGSLWGSGLVPCVGVRCRGAAQAGYRPPPYSWGRVHLGFYGVQKSQNLLQSEILLFMSNYTIKSIFSGVSPPPPSKLEISQPLNRQCRLDSISNWPYPRNMTFTT